MSKKPLKIVIVDDEDAYRRKLAAKLTDRTMKCVPIAPPQSPIGEEIFRERPDAVLVDYQLTQAQRGTSAPPAAYLGSLLVAAVRDRLPTTPIILLTRRKLASSDKDFLARASDLDGAFDDLRYKETVDAKPATLRTELRSLVEGYRTLSKSQGSWVDVLEALETPKYAQDELLNLGSPGGTLTTEVFRPVAVARWLRRVVLRFPGPLVDDLRAATDLGITLQSFRKDAVLKWLRPALYTGIFASEERRWWRGALRARAQVLGAHESADDADDGARFLKQWNAKHPAARLAAAKCCVCGLPTNEGVCEVLQRPVMMRCSVPYHPDNRPSGFDVARISFKAIREKELNDSHFASNVLPIVREVEKSEVEDGR